MTASNLLKAGERILGRPTVGPAGRIRFNKGPLNEWDLCLLRERAQWEHLVSTHCPLPYCERPSDRYHVKLPPWLDMPPEAKRFQRIGNLPVAGNFTGLDIQLQFQGVTGPLFQCDVGYDGVITEVVLDIVSSGATGFVQASGDVTWRVGVDLGQATNEALWYYRDYGNVINTFGSLTQPSELGGAGGLRFISGQKISVYVNLLVAAQFRINPNAVIIGSIAGWTYPR